MIEEKAKSYETVPLGQQTTELEVRKLKQDIGWRSLEQIVPDWYREAIHRCVNLLANKGPEHFQSG